MSLLLSPAAPENVVSIDIITCASCGHTGGSFLQPLTLVPAVRAA